MDHSSSHRVKEMGRRSGRTRALDAIVCAVLLSLAATCRNETAQDAYRAAREAADRKDLKAASSRVEAALKRFSGEDNEWVWALKILEIEIVARNDRERAAALLERTPLPPQYARSEAAVRRLLTMTMVHRKSDFLVEAHAVAQRHQPSLLPDVHMTFANFPPLESAVEHAHTAIDLATALHKEIGIGNAYSVLGYAYTRAERYVEAIDAQEEGMRRYEKLGAVGRISAVAGNLAYTYALIGDDESAEELFKRAADAAEKSGIADEWMRWLNQLGNMALGRGDYDAADRYYAKAFEIATKAQLDDAADISANRALVAIERGRIADAESFNARARGLASQIIGARIEQARGQFGRAEQTLRAVAAKAAEERRSDKRWEAQARLANLYAVTGHYDLASTEFRSALETANEARAQVPDLGLKLSFFNLVAQIYDAYIDFLVDQNRIDEALAVTELSRAQSLEEGLGVAKSAHAFDARAIAKQRNATILCYWLGRTRAYVWVVTPSSIALHSLPASKSIEKELAAYRRDLRGVNGTLQASGDRGRALYRMLVAPAGAIEKDARVIVVADGKLHELNFETLVHGDRYWIEDVTVSNASSLQLLAHRSNDRVRDQSLLLVGNAPTVDESYPHLQHAWAEMSAVRKQFASPRMLSDRDATPLAYRDAEPSRFAYLHFVAHGVASRLRPLESAVILGRDRSGYKLLARDIVQQRLRARLVTISSCHGAGTRTYRGEGLVGLAWAFLAAGSENVIGALWEVNDAATPKLMEQMYIGLRNGADPAVALRNAKLAFLRSEGIQRKPNYWAPFVLYTGS
jgi:CHAT domain-containing protein/Tfp pilus assembly protein PilF